MRKALLARLQSSWWFAWIAAIFLGLAQLKDATDGLERVLVLTGVRPDALALARSVDKGAFSRDFAETAWKRLYWARLFVGRLERGASQEAVDEAHKAYVLSSEAWASRIMIYIVNTERFYGADRAVELEKQVVSAMNQVSEAVSDLRYPRPGASPNHGSADAAIDAANAALFRFVRGFDLPKP